MRRVAIAVFLCAALSAPEYVFPSPGEIPGGDEAVLRVNDTRITRAEFEREYVVPAFRSRWGKTPPDTSLKIGLLRETADRFLLGADTIRHLLEGNPLWVASLANLRDEYVGRKWFEDRYHVAPGMDPPDAGTIFPAIEKKYRVERFLPLMKDGKIPPGPTIVARVDKEGIPFDRVRAMASRGYFAFMEWPGGATEESLLAGMENVIRFRILAMEAGSRGDEWIDSSSFRRVLHEYAAWIGRDKCRHEASLPFPELDAAIADLRRRPPSYLSIVVQVFKGNGEKDVADLKKELMGIPSGSRGVGARVQGIRQDGKPEFWPRVGFLPKELEIVLKESAPGESFSPVVASDNAFYLARILDRKPPPPALAEAVEKDTIRQFREGKFYECIGNVMDRARAENRVEIREEILRREEK